MLRRASGNFCRFNVIRRCMNSDGGCKKKDPPCPKVEPVCPKKEEPCPKKEEPCPKKEDPCPKKKSSCGDNKPKCPEKDDACKEDVCKKDDGCKKTKLNADQVIWREEKFIFNIQKPIPCVISKAEGMYMYDTDGKKYLDFIAAYGSVNQGHRHPKIVAAFMDQVCKVPHTSRAFNPEVLGEYCEFITKMFGYEKVAPMNTGVEAGDTALKLARQWGHKVKQIVDKNTKIVFARGNFWGRSLAAVSSSTDPLCYKGFGPYMPGFVIVDYNDLKCLEEAFKDPNVCAFMVEPIQGEAGVIVPCDGYLKGVRELCTKYKVLMVADEVQTGLGRCGARLACDLECVRPDVLILAKSLSGGLLPVSAVLADNEIARCMEVGSHGSTFGGCPLGCKVAMAALCVMEDEKLAQNAEKKGEQFRGLMEEKLPKEMVTEIRGKGLMNAVEVDKKYCAWDICIKMKENGLLTKPTHGTVIRFTPPLIINQDELCRSCNIIAKSFCALLKKDSC